MATSDIVPEERIRIRRRRRWIRRARILAPFVALPILLVVLLFSVNQVKYRSKKPDQKSAENSIDRKFLDEWSSDSTSTYTPENPIADFEAEAGIPFALDFNLRLPPLQAQELRASTQP